MVSPPKKGLVQILDEIFLCGVFFGYSSFFSQSKNIHHKWIDYSKLSQGVNVCVCVVLQQTFIPLAGIGSNNTMALNRTKQVLKIGLMDNTSWWKRQNLFQGCPIECCLFVSLLIWFDFALKFCGTVTSIHKGFYFIF